MNARVFAGCRRYRSRCSVVIHRFSAGTESCAPTADRAGGIVFRAARCGPGGGAAGGRAGGAPAGARLVRLARCGRSGCSWRRGRSGGGAPKLPRWRGRRGGGGGGFPGGGGGAVVHVDLDACATEMDEHVSRPEWRARTGMPGAEFGRDFELLQSQVAASPLDAWRHAVVLWRPVLRQPGHGHRERLEGARAVEEESALYAQPPAPGRTDQSRRRHWRHGVGRRRFEGQHLGARAQSEGVSRSCSSSALTTS